LRLARADRSEPLCHLAKAPHLARIHFTVEPGAMTYPDSQRNVRAEFPNRRILNPLVVWKDFVIRVSSFLGDNPVCDLPQGLADVMTVLATGFGVFDTEFVRSGQFERKSDLAFLVFYAAAIGQRFPTDPETLN